MLTQDRLKEWLSYDPESGLFVWLKGLRKGHEAGNLDRYRMIWIEGTKYPASKLAWLYMTGEYPSFIIDHKNRISGDDRWANLRRSNQSQNNHNRSVLSNSSSGIKGVRQLGNKYYAFIRKDGVRHNLGSFNKVEDAMLAYRTAAQKLFGEFADAN